MKLLLTVPEAAKALGISRSKLYQLLSAGTVLSVRIDGSRRVPVESLTAYINQLMEEAALWLARRTPTSDPGSAMAS